MALDLLGSVSPGASSSLPGDQLPSTLISHPGASFTREMNFVSHHCRGKSQKVPSGPAWAWSASGTASSART